MPRDATLLLAGEPLAGFAATDPVELALRDAVGCGLDAWLRTLDEALALCDGLELRDATLAAPFGLEDTARDADVLGLGEAFDAVALDEVGRALALPARFTDEARRGAIALKVRVEPDDAVVDAGVAPDSALGVPFDGDDFAASDALEACTLSLVAGLPGALVLLEFDGDAGVPLAGAGSGEPYCADATPTARSPSTAPIPIRAPARPSRGERS